MFKDLDLSELRRIPRISYYFRYPLHHGNFHELRLDDRLCGHYTAKPLYGRLTAEGKVDRSAGYNGDVAALFIPTEAQSVQAAQLVLTHMEPQRITLPNGRRNWPAIREAAQRRLGELLAA